MAHLLNCYLIASRGRRSHRSIDPADDLRKHPYPLMQGRLSCSSIVSIDPVNCTVRKAHMNFRISFIKCSCLAASALLSVHAFADIYKCTDDAGNISYVQNPTNAGCVLLDGSAATTGTTVVAPAPETVEHPVAVKKRLDERNDNPGPDNQPEVIDSNDRRDTATDRNAPITPNRPIGRRR